MRKPILLFLIFCLSFSFADNAHSQVPEIAGATAVKELLQKFRDDLHGIIGNATSSGNYLVEKAAREALVVLSSFEVILEKQLNKSFDRIGDLEQEALGALAGEIDKIKGMKDSILNYAEFFTLDVNNLINRIPFLKKKYFILKIKGFGQEFRETGHYTYKILGNAFSLNNKIKVEFSNRNIVALDDMENMLVGTFKTRNGRRVPTMENMTPSNASYYHVERDGELIIKILAEYFNDQFRKRDVTRVPIKIRVYRKQKPFWKIWRKSKFKKIFEYSGQTLLLPKYPIKYEFTEYYGQRAKSREIRWASNDGVIGATGKPAKKPNPLCGEREVKCEWICVKAPRGTQFIQGKTRWSQSYSGHGALDGSEYRDGYTEYCILYKHWKHNDSRKVTVQAGYHPLSTEVRSRNSSLSPTHGQSGLSKIARVEKLLRFGEQYSVRLSDKNKSFDLSYWYFNGERGAISPKSPKHAPKFTFYTERRKGFKRILVKFNP